MKTLLFILLCFVALTATLSGMMMIISPDGSSLSLSLGLLKGSPFRDFQIPGILLAMFVGGSNMVAVFYNMARHRNRYNWALAGGLTISGWIIAQMIIIQTFHWLHIVYLVTGIIIILAAFQLKGKALI